jgi:hypothetical protein
MDTKMPSIGFLLNECQRSSAMHKKCARMMLEKRKEKGESFLEELVYHLQHVLLVFKQDSGVDRVLNFIVTFVTTREEGLEEDCDEFLESTRRTRLYVTESANSSLESSTACKRMPKFRTTLRTIS